MAAFFWANQSTIGRHEPLIGIKGPISRPKNTFLEPSVSRTRERPSEANDQSKQETAKKDLSSLFFILFLSSSFLSLATSSHVTSSLREFVACLRHKKHLNIQHPLAMICVENPHGGADVVLLGSTAPSSDYADHPLDVAPLCFQDCSGISGFVLKNDRKLTTP